MGFHNLVEQNRVKSNGLYVHLIDARNGNMRRKCSSGPFGGRKTLCHAFVKPLQQGTSRWSFRCNSTTCTNALSLLRSEQMCTCVNRPQWETLLIFLLVLHFTWHLGPHIPETKNKWCHSGFLYFDICRQASTYATLFRLKIISTSSKPCNLQPCPDTLNICHNQSHLKKFRFNPKPWTIHQHMPWSLTSRSSSDDEELLSLIKSKSGSTENREKDAIVLVRRCTVRLYWRGSFCKCGEEYCE